MIRAKNEKHLLDILRVISSEAVSLSKKTNENKDPSLKKFMSQYKKDENLYGSLSEQEEDEPPVDDTPEKESPPEEPEAEPETEPETEPEETADIGASFDSVVKAVNNLRAGKSLRDSSIKQQAQDYYDKLTDDERVTLLVFLKAMSGIIAGQVAGAEAQDPGDPPVSINISSDGEEPPEEQSDEEPPAEGSEEPSEDSEVQVEDEDAEDTTPPIRVNESQDIANLRKKVRRMMLRG